MTPARVAQLKAGQLDLIAPRAARRRATLEKDAKLRIAKADSVYVFITEFDFRDKPAMVTAKDGSPLPKNPFLDPKVREAFDLAIDREALAEIAMEGLGKAGFAGGHRHHLRLNPAVKVTKADPKKAKQLLARRGRLSQRLQGGAVLHHRPPAERRRGGHLHRADAGPPPASMPRPMASPARCSSPPPARRLWPGHVGLGHAHRRGQLHPRPASCTPTPPATKLGGFNVRGYSNPALDKLIEDAAVEMDIPKRRALAGAGGSRGGAGSSQPAHRLHRQRLGHAEGQGDLHARVDEDNAGHEHQAVK